MIDLISHGVRVAGPPGLEVLVIPSISFSAKCAETQRQWDPARGPLPPP